MIQYIRVNQHKGIESLVLPNIGRINVLCGKNNSGKTSILEALVMKDKYFEIGRIIDEKTANWMIESFEEQTKNFANPSSYSVLGWFKEFIKNHADNGSVWFSDDLSHVNKLAQESWRKKPYLASYAPINLDKTLNQIFEKPLKNFNPILIPPKRIIENNILIELNQPIEPRGGGLINRLFYLKNQPINSEEFKIYQKIDKAFTDITGFQFNIFPEVDNKIRLNYCEYKKENWLYADSCGLGLSDMLVLVSFILDFEYSFILIEEPESHLHPEMQLRFLEFLKGINNKQFILSTHSSIFLNPYKVDKIYYCRFGEKVEIDDKTSKSQILFNLGYSVADNLVSDLVILTEGPSDIPVLRKILEWIGVDSAYNIKYWPLGGDIMAELDLAVFAENNRVIALIDKDPGSSQIRTRFKRKCEEKGIKCHQLKKYSIENYFSVDAIRKVFPEDVPNDLNKITPNQSIDKILKLKEKGKTIKSKNESIVQQMSIEDFRGSDLLDFCEKVKELCNQNDAR